LVDIVHSPYDDVNAAHQSEDVQRLRTYRRTVFGSEDSIGWKFTDNSDGARYYFDKAIRKPMAATKPIETESDENPEDRPSSLHQPVSFILATQRAAL
jgi:hypothetical protein